MDFTILRRLSLQSPKTAILCGDDRLSFADLDQRSSRLAEKLKNKDLGESKAVALFAPSSLEYVVGLIAIWKAGGMAVPLHVNHPTSEIQYIIENAEARVVLSSAGLASAALETIAEVMPIEADEGREVGGTSVAPVSVQASAGALMIYTSGTTRRPKGVVTSFSGLEAQIQSLLEAWRWSETDRTINVLPLHHVHGVVNILCCSLASGAACEMVAKFDPVLVWRRIRHGDISVFMAVPTIYARLLEFWQAEAAAEREVLSERAKALRLMVSGSAALPAPLFEAWERASGHRLLERYGMTEIGMALSNPYEGPRVPGRVGFPLPGVSVRLAGDRGEVIREPEVSGEIQVKGPGVFRSYWRLPEISQESFTADGWFKTGDVAERDQQGSYRILGRLSQDIIKSGGYKISALEIESALLEHAEIAEVAVVGIADQEWGERVAAVYVARGRVEEDECREFLKSRLAHYKIPTRWKRVEALPRNTMGKIVKSQVRTLL